ncbi:hypothetical protein OH76DRAFT_305008 [Lentinus brumalis]|uniref:Uncharacterized protein n=1 Tax=Lentinus brumalis TaxID=2498619 RepID=A0A371CKE1_9APHY|nr:hypothetical protein OH76DRAFT_305008 [Polyporus brumalis]
MPAGIAQERTPHPWGWRSGGDDECQRLGHAGRWRTQRCVCGVALCAASSLFGVPLQCILLARYRLVVQPPTTWADRAQLSHAADILEDEQVRRCVRCLSTTVSPCAARVAAVRQACQLNYKT